MPVSWKERWPAISPHLERLLEMTPEERVSWLDALRAEDPTLADDLRTLLEEHAVLGARGFLEQDPPRFTQATLAGQTLGAYTLETAIGQGGMGTVWLAHRSDGRFEGRVAVKFLNAGLIGPAGAERFRREGIYLARLTHPCIAHLLDAGLSGTGQPYLVLEYVEGSPIDQYCDNEKLGLDARIRLFLDVVAAVGHAHANLIVHRDIKPSNVLVRQDGQVKLLDFGIAKLLEDEGGLMPETTLTREGGSALTPEYAAPEQVSGQAITTSTDVYALGVVLYVLLSGRHPFADAAGSPADMIKAVVDTEPARVSAAVCAQNGAGDQAALRAERRGTTPDRLRRALEGDLETIVAKALKKLPQERYGSVGELGDDLRRYLNGEPVLARSDAFVYRAGKLILRHRALAAVSALAVVATLGGLGVAVWQAREARYQRDRALALLGRSEAVTEFFQSLLNDAGPPDQPQTIHAMLKRSESLVDSEFAGNPEHQAAILMVQGSYYVTLGNAAEGEPRLRRALALATAAGDGDLRGQIGCLHGYAQSLLGKAEEGAREVERLLNDPQLSPASAATCHESLAFIAQNQGDGQGAEQHARAAQALLARADRPSPRLEASLLADLAFAQQLLGRIDAADALFAQSLAKMTAMGRERTPLALTIRNNWGIATLSSGNIRHALTVFEEAIRAARARDADSPPPSYLTANLARALELGGRYPEALVIYQQAADEGRRNQRPETVAFGHLGMASVYLEIGEVDRAESLLNDVRATVDQVFPPGSPPMVTADVLTGRIMLARGRLDQARDTLRDALTLLDKGGRSGAGGVMARLYLAEVALRSNRPNEAETLARQALDSARSLQAGVPHSNRTGLSFLALAEALTRLGRADEARQALSSAVEHLQQALGQEHPATRKALRLQGELAGDGAR